MNKKILSIFALIMALSFAVSCSNDSNNPNKGNGGGTGDTSLVLTVGDGSITKTLKLTAPAANTATDTTGAFSVTEDDTKVTYTVTSAAAVSTSPTGFTPASGKAFEALTEGTISTVANYTIKSDKKITIGGTLANALAADLSDNTKCGLIELVITATKDGKTCELKIYIEVTKN